MAYHRQLKRIGMPFSGGGAGQYQPLGARELNETLLGDAIRITKSVPMAQVADLYLFPIAKAGYDPNYGPYCALREAGRLIDAEIPADSVSSCGIKYSCFDPYSKKP
jgi:hypothetical protein